MPIAVGCKDGPLSLRLAVETKEIVHREKLELMGDNLNNLDETVLKPCRIVDQYC